MRDIPKWVKNFVSYDEETDEFVAWDETQADELGRYNTREAAEDICIAYAKSIEGELR